MKKLIFCAIVFILSATIPPAQAQGSTHANTVTWAASTSIGATYNVYKQPGCVGSFTKLNTAPVTFITFTDSGMVDGELNCYLATAVLGGSESAQSASQVIRLVTPSVTPGLTVTQPPGPGSGKAS